MISIDREIKKCFKCGMCRAVCPVLEALDIETAGPRAKVAVCEAVQAGRFKATKTVMDMLARCTGCRACSLNCTSGTDPYGLAVLAGFQQGRGKHALPKPSGPVSLFLTGILSGRKKNLGGFAAGSKRGPASIGYFIGCAELKRNRAVPENVMNILEDLGIRVAVPKEQVCCGWPHILAGRLDDAKKIALTNRKAFEGFDVVLSSCPHCMTTLSSDYPALFGVHAFERRTSDALDFLVGKKLDGRLGIKTRSSRILFSHPCRMGRYKKVNTVYFEFLKERLGNALAGHDSKECCGAPLDLAYPATAKLMLKRKMKSSANLKNPTIMSHCPFCIMAIGSVRGAKVKHVLECLKVKN
jgi:Fe-S oxidoreductase